MKPRTLCACQPVVFIISAIDAPMGRLKSPTIWLAFVLRCFFADVFAADLVALVVFFVMVVLHLRGQRIWPVHHTKPRNCARLLPSASGHVCVPVFISLAMLPLQLKSSGISPKAQENRTARHFPPEP
jgi:hypothetical protein